MASLPLSTALTTACDSFDATWVMHTVRDRVEVVPDGSGVSNLAASTDLDSRRAITTGTPNERHWRLLRTSTAKLVSLFAERLLVSCGTSPQPLLIGMSVHSAAHAARTGCRPQLIHGDERRDSHTGES